ncbi:MAG: hypothetical protein ACLR23_11980 [Clostridia bacterium]
MVKSLQNRHRRWIDLSQSRWHRWLRRLHLCSAGGSGEFAQRWDGTPASISAQLEQGAARLRQKYKGNAYIAYFQSFTNTYAPVEILEALYRPVLAHPSIVGLAIATRPDCLPDDVIRLLRDLALQKPIFLELGLQTVHEATARRIQPGVFPGPFRRHLGTPSRTSLPQNYPCDFGAPRETMQDMLDTVDYVVRIRADGIKLALLHVLKGTPLAADYEAGTLPLLSREAYIDIAARCLSRIPLHGRASDYR